MYAICNGARVMDFWAGFTFGVIVFALVSLCGYAGWCLLRERITR